MMTGVWNSGCYEIVPSLKGGEVIQYLVEISRSANWRRERLLYLPHVLCLFVRLFNGALNVVNIPAQEELPQTVCPSGG